VPPDRTDALEWIVPQIRSNWPDMRIILRADSGFTRDPIMTWCEGNGVEFVLGLAKNPSVLPSPAGSGKGAVRNEGVIRQRSISDFGARSP